MIEFYKLIVNSLEKFYKVVVNNLMMVS